MKNSITYPGLFILTTLISLSGCRNPREKNSHELNLVYTRGTYGSDAAFFKKNNISFIELKDSSTGAFVLIVPGYQARVMTSTAGGYEGKSFGWINYKHIESGVVSQQFNPFGGEERFWLGPEGGPFSVYFRKGDEHVFSNWKVPAQLDTDTFDLVSANETYASFTKDFSLTNAAGTLMDIGVERNISLLDRSSVENVLNMEFDDSLSFVAYETENTLINKGSKEWTRNSGFLSIWMLGMFNPSEKGVVVIPFKPDNPGIVTDDYFGKVPGDRLIIKDSILFFRVDGKHRSKIGISPEGAENVCGSYDPDSHTLTLLWLSLPEKSMPYVNSKWGPQDNPLKGDAVNSYNDGPVEDGSIMGPFYELESSSPAALLSPGEKITHIQKIFHITGDEAKLSTISENLFGVTIDDIKSAF